MVYAYDRNILMPVKDLYDTKIMALALSAAKDEYDKAEKRLDDLTKLYGDFYSPSDVDMTNWQTKVVNPIKGAVDDLYARGIDPLRSAEGLAMLARISRDLPYDDINQLKETAEVGKEYVKNAKALLALGLYDPEYEKLNGRDLKNWDTLNNGVWGYSSPAPLRDMPTIVSPWYEKRTARPLTQEEVVGEGAEYDPMKDYTGFIGSDIRKVAESNLPAFLNTPEGQYQKHLARLQVAAQKGISPEEVLDEEANEQLLENAAGAAQRWYIGPTGELNKVRLAEHEAKLDLDNYRKKAAILNYYNTKPGNKDVQQEAAYDIKTRLFNEGVANLAGIPVTVINDVLHKNSNLGQLIVDNQAILAKSGSPESIINTLVKNHKRSRKEIADILEIDQTGDADKNNLIYSISKSEIDNIVDDRYIVSRMQTGDPVDTGVDDAGTNVLRLTLRGIHRDKLKISPTGRVATYLDKDGTIKNYAEIELVGVNSFGSNKAFIDLGNSSTQVSETGPIGMDWTTSTLRDRGYDAINLKTAGNTTKTVKTSWNNPPTE